MRLVHVTLLYLGSLTFLEAGATRLDVASQFKRKWTKWSLSRSKRDANPSSASSGRAAAADVQPLIRQQDEKEELRGLPPSGPADARIRVKRYRPGTGSFPHFQVPRRGCRFGTCTIQQLAHQIYQLTDKDKDDAAPQSKISPQGYGRRRRSAPAPRRARGPGSAAPGRPGWLPPRPRAPARGT